MGSESNKRVITRMFAAQLSNDISAYSEILADDLQWEIMQFGIDKPRSKSEMIAMLGAVHRNLRGGLWTKDVASMVGERESVAVEATAMMQLSNGNIYRQRYHYVYKLRGGQVYFAREYLDTHAAVEAFKGLPPIAPPKD